MSPDGPRPKPDSAASLSDLASRISQADARDPQTQAVLVDLIQGFRSQIAARQRRFMGCMDAAATLVRSLATLDEETAKEVQEVAARLLDVVADARARELPAVEPSEQASENKAAVSSEGLETLNDMALCELLVQLGVTTQDQVDRALREAAQTGQAVEDSLYAIGAVGPEDVFRAMKLQQALATAPGEKAAPDTGHAAGTLHAILLGEILVSMGRISREQLDRALEHQRAARVRLGEALVELGYATWEDVAEAVGIQAERGGSSERNTDATIIRLD